jgi:hypothetical protein
MYTHRKWLMTPPPGTEHPKTFVYRLAVNLHTGLLRRENATAIAIVLRKTRADGMFSVLARGSVDSLMLFSERLYALRRENAPWQVNEQVVAPAEAEALFQRISIAPTDYAAIHNGVRNNDSSGADGVQEAVQEPVQGAVQPVQGAVQQAVPSPSSSLSDSVDTSSTATASTVLREARAARAAIARLQEARAHAEEASARAEEARARAEEARARAEEARAHAEEEARAREEHATAERERLITRLLQRGTFSSREEALEFLDGGAA